LIIQSRTITFAIPSTRQFSFWLEITVFKVSIFVELCFSVTVPVIVTSSPMKHGALKFRDCEKYKENS